MDAPETLAVSSQSEFAGRRILITGAAGSFGRATAAKLAEAGAKLVLNGRDRGKLEKLASDLGGSGHNIAPFDLTNGDGIVDWLKGLAEKDGPFHGLAHIAGICVMRPMRTVNAEFIDKTLMANVVSGIMLGKAFRQKICHMDGASYVLLSSTASHICGGGNVAYAASKGAVTASAKGMAHELLRDHIRVNCVVPAIVESDIATRMKDMVPPENWQIMVDKHPLGLGVVADIAAAVVYLLSDATRWMTGTALQLDGGLGIT